MSALFLAAALQLASLPDCTVPGMPPENLVAVARQESGLRPYAIRDERTDRSYYPNTLEEAEALATRLTAQGHLLGVGLMQLTPPANFGLSIREALDPCRNMKAGAQLLADNYRRAMREALSRYNSGHPTRSENYARRVEALAANIPRIAGGAPPVAVAAPPPAAPVITGQSFARGKGRELVFARNP